MGFYDIDFDKGVWEELPINERTPIRYSWLKALLYPVKVIYGLFMAFRAEILYRLAHNGQVCYLEAMLNDAFDNVDRGIYITDGAAHDPLYIYMASEVKPVFIDLVSEVGTGVIPEPDPVRLYVAGEVDSSQGDFIVHVPSAVYAALAVGEIDKMRALLNTYKLVGKTYSIVTF